MDIKLTYRYFPIKEVDLSKLEGDKRYPTLNKNGECDHYLGESINGIYYDQVAHVLLPIEADKNYSENEAMVNAFYKVAEAIDFTRPENKDLFDIIYPFLHTRK
jgi:hypothetical protein